MVLWTFLGRIARRLIPESTKPTLRKLGKPVEWIFNRPVGQDEAHRIWREVAPEDYLHADPSRSHFLVDLVRKYAEPDAKILEIGCNVGRNLAHLAGAGFRNLEGVEISERAVRLLREAYPELALITKVHNAPIEKVISKFRDGEFDLVFTMAVLEHIHEKSTWVFPEMSRITEKFLITIEDEYRRTPVIFPRNYREIFEAYGMTQLEAVKDLEAEGLRGLAYVENFVARVFAKT